MTSSYSSFFKPIRFSIANFFTKNLKLLGLLTCLLLLTTTTQSQNVVINEVFANGSFELKNNGNTAVNISTFWICNFPDYRQLNSLTIECGELNLQPGAEVVFTASGLYQTSDSELGLYTNNNFGSSAGMLSYVEWGSSGHQRSSVAVGAGVWTTGNFVASFNNSQSLLYDGAGNQSSDWSINSSPNACADVTPTCNVSGGTIATSDPTTVCADDGAADMVNASLSGASGDNMDWIITDNQNNILMLPSAPPFNFEGAGAGICQIWSISSDNTLTGLNVGNNLSQLGGCFELSNSISVTRQTGSNSPCAVAPTCNVTGGSITTSDPTTVCADDGTADMVNASLSGASGTTGWIITDNQNNILMLPSAPPFNFEGAGAGICQIWSISSDNTLTGLNVGNNLSQLGGCFELSNSISVTRQTGSNSPCAVAPTCNVTGGSITTSDPTTVCADDGTADMVNASLSGASGTTGWIITDNQNNILMLPSAPPFNFEGAGAGVCGIWSISSDNTLTGLNVGNNLSQLGGCFELSNSISVTRQTGSNSPCAVAPTCNVTGGSITTSDPTTVCADDGTADMVNASLSGASGTTGWIITDNQNNILMLPSAPPLILKEQAQEFVGYGV